MKRKDFLRTLALSAASLGTLPALLSACSKDSSGETITESQKFEGKITIIGAGAAGLYAACLLTQRGYDVTILEASGRPGGRAMKLTGFSDFNIELGAEVIRGSISRLYQFAGIARKNFVTLPVYDYYYLNGLYAKASVFESDPGLVAAQDFINSIPQYSAGDIPVSDVISSGNIPASVSHILRAKIGNECGSSNERIGMLSLAQAKRNWSSGSDNLFIKDGTMIDILEYNLNSVYDKIKFNTPVRDIDYSGSTITIKDSGGTSYSCDRVIVTVPLAILRQEFIRFAPKLPAEKLSAISSVGMDAGLKVILKFTNPFWDSKTGAIVAPGIVPLYRAAGSGGRSGLNNVLTASFSGKEADYANSLGGGLIQAILEDLGGIYGSSSVVNNLNNFYIQDWTNEPYIGGSFSYASPDSTAMRPKLAAQVNNKVYFAGEATHTGGNFGTLHGALETAERVVEEVTAL